MRKIQILKIKEKLTMAYYLTKFEEYNNLKDAILKSIDINSLKQSDEIYFYHLLSNIENNSL